MPTAQAKSTLDDAPSATVHNGQKPQAQVSAIAPAEVLDETQSLVSRNPFGNAPSSKSAESEQEQNLFELTSVYFIDDKWNFVVVDTANKISYALVLKGQISDEIPLQVNFFDEESMSISLSNAVAEYVLTLKTPEAPTQTEVAAAPAQKEKKQQKAQQNNRRNFQGWIYLNKVEVPKAKRINRR